MGRKNKPILVDTLDMPSYFIKRLGDRQFIVGGGGGSSKTGVPNAVHILTLTLRNGRCTLRPSQQVDLGASCPMNAAVFEVQSSLNSSRNAGKSKEAPEKNVDGSFELLDEETREVVAVGSDNKCVVYEVRRSLPAHDIQPVLPGGPNKVQPAPHSQHDMISLVYRETFETFTGNDGIQNCCVFLPPDSTKASGNRQANLATGASDGMLKIWMAKDRMQLVGSLKAHAEDFEDIDLSPAGDEILTCGKDKTCSVWNLKTLKKSASVLPEFPEAKACQYRPRKARYHAKDPSTLYVVWIPVMRQKKNPAPSVICVHRFKSSSLIIAKHLPVKGDWLCALTVSPDGHYLATGNLEGNVNVYRTTNLELIYVAENAHQTFVTGLEFTDSTFPAKVLTQTEDAFCTVFSVSADRRIVMHQADHQNVTLKSCQKWARLAPLLWLLVVFGLLLMRLLGYEELLGKSLNSPAAGHGSHVHHGHHHHHGHGHSHSHSEL